MSSWADGPLYGFDLETTSTDPTQARIVTASGVTYDDNAHTITHEWIAYPQEEIPVEATAIHGITTEFARANGRYPFYVAIEIGEWLESIWTADQPVVIYNAPYDLTVLDCELARYCEQGLLDYGPLGAVVDPLTIDKHVDRYRKGSRKLSAVCEHYGVELTDAHSSTADALAAIKLAQAIAQRYPEIAEMSLVELRQAQMQWYQEQQFSFANYLMRQALKASTVERTELTERAHAIRLNASGWPYRMHSEVST